MHAACQWAAHAQQGAPSQEFLSTDMGRRHVSASTSGSSALLERPLLMPALGCQAGAEEHRAIQLKVDV